MHNGYSWDDLRFLLAVARAGTLSGAARSLGVGHHFAFQGDADPELERVTQPEGYDFGLWILTHPDLRRTARIRRFVDFLADACADKRAAFEAR